MTWSSGNNSLIPIIKFLLPAKSCPFSQRLLQLSNMVIADRLYEHGLKNHNMDLSILKGIDEVMVYTKYLCFFLKFIASTKFKWE